MRVIIKYIKKGDYDKQLLKKLKQDRKMCVLSYYTKDSYYKKAKEIKEYLGKQ